MRWLKPSLRNSLYNLLGNPARPTESVLETGAEDIRECMLDLLGERGSADHPHLARRLRYATDVHALWYLRGDLMAVIARGQGESVARRQMQSITRMFEGLLPMGMTSRPSSLWN